MIISTILKNTEESTHPTKRNLDPSGDEQKSRSCELKIKPVCCLGLELGAKEQEKFFRDDRSMLKLYCGDGCTTVNLLKLIQLHT